MELVFHNQFRRLIYPEDLESTWNSVQIQMAQGKTKKIEYRVRCRDGRLVTVLDHGQLVERDGKKVFYCILTDITENRKILEELHLSLEKHRIIMEQTNDIIFEWDLFGQLGENLRLFSHDGECQHHGPLQPCTP